MLLCRHLGCGPSRLSLRILPLPPSTSVDLEPKGVVVVFEVVKFRASKSSLGVGPKAPIPFRSQSLCYAGQACMDGSEKQPLGPPCRRRRSSLPQSSPATSCTCVARGVLKNWILMESTSGRRIRIQRHAFVHLACLASSVAGVGLTCASSVCSRQREQTIRRGCNRCSSSV